MVLKILFSAVLGLFALNISAKTFILPHVLESSGRITNTQYTFDTQFFIVYSGTMDNAASVDLYVYDSQTGDLLQSATGDPVCNPCTRDLGRASPRQSVSLDAEITGKGGFSGGGAGGSSLVHAFAIAVVTGDTDQVSVSAELLHANQNPSDLSIVLEPAQAMRESPSRPSLKRVFILPHVLESSGKITTDASSFDMDVVALYTGGLPGLSADSGATVDLYLYDNAGTPLRSGTGTDVCNPCTENLAPVHRSARFNLDDLITAKGGFSSSFAVGFGILVVSGADPDRVAMQAFVVNSHTSPLDLAVFGFNPVEIAAARLATGKELARPGLARSFSGSPNPTGGGILFDLTLGQPADVSLDIYTIDGRKVATAYQGHVSAGAGRFSWNGKTSEGTPLTPGNYFARLNTREGTLISRIVVVR